LTAGLCTRVRSSASGWLKCYPRYHLVFVPAGCTGKAQPADVGLQRPFKHAIKKAFTAWLTEQIHHTVKGGKAPSEVKIDAGLARLKPLLVEWTWLSWDSLKQRRDLIKEGWERCGLARVLDAALQTEAMRYCMNEPTQALGEEADGSGLTDSEEDEDDDEEKEEEVFNDALAGNGGAIGCVARGSD
jgi:hypothetical protein